METDKIKESFFKVKEDISQIKQAINLLSEEMEEQKYQLEEIKRTLIQTENSDRQTNQQTIPTDKLSLNTLKPQNLMVSTGNEGVPTDRQTNQQTDRQTQKFVLNTKNGPRENNSLSLDHISKIAQVSEILDSLTDFKKELRFQIRKLTPQEMLIFSTLYQFVEEGRAVDYSLLANKMKLSESSIRDYILKIIKKGFPVDKIKENNKKVVLSIPEKFKKIAPLNTLLALRDI